MTLHRGRGRPRDRLQGAVAADGRAGRLADRADGGPAALALRAGDDRASPDGGHALHGDRAVGVDLGAGRQRADHRGGAGGGPALARDLRARVHRGDRRGAALAARPRGAGGGPGRVLRAPARVDRRDGGARRGREPDHALRGPRAALDPALRAVRGRAEAEDLARGGPQVPGGRVGGLGDAALRAGPHLRRHRGDELPGHPGRHRRGRVGHGPAPAHRHRPHGHRPGLQGVGGPVPPVDAGRLPGRTHAGHRLHGRGHQGGRVRRVPEAVRPRPRPRPAPVGPGAGRAGRGDHRGGQRRGDRAALAQADARLVERRARRATCSPAWWWAASWA